MTSRMINYARFVLAFIICSIAQVSHSGGQEDVEINLDYSVKMSDEKNNCYRRIVNSDFDYYMISLTYSPEFCRRVKERYAGNLPRENLFQCVNNKFGWVVHGLWPQLNSPELCLTDDRQVVELHPRYCQGDLPNISPSLVASVLGMMPSSKLVQGEWIKHGACGKFTGPAEYLSKTKELFESLTLPEEYLPPPVIFQWIKDHNSTFKGKKILFDGKSGELRLCYSKGWSVIDCP